MSNRSTNKPIALIRLLITVSGLSTIFILAVFVAHARGDELLYRYEADVVPYDISAGWGNGLCDGPCSESLANGYFILTFAGGGDLPNYTQLISLDPVKEPQPESLWVEWRYRSDQAIGPFFTTRDGSFKVRFSQMQDTIHMYGDAVVSNEGGDFVTGLDIDEFHTYRFESLDGLNYTFSVDGQVFLTEIGTQNITNAFLQLRGTGGEDGFAVNEWDFVRYGTISDGESIVSSDPPSGLIDPLIHPSLDRFTITFDQPGYVYLDDITVETTGGSVPVVLQTLRLDNGDPETVEIVLDRPLTSGETFIFTFDTGGLPNVVEYTVLQHGSCCLPEGECVEADHIQCADMNGNFSANGSCSATQTCCLNDGSCRVLVTRCCAVQSGTVKFGQVCIGDPDIDGVDGLCGDDCPDDPRKVDPGQCGCGFLDTDRDQDSVADCLDECPFENDRIDANRNGIPDCVEEIVIPAVSDWGMVILILMLLIALRICCRLKA